MPCCFSYTSSNLSIKSLYVSLVDVNIVPVEVDRDYRPQLELTGNIAATVQGLATHLERQMTADTDKAVLKEIARDRAMFTERAASLNGTPIHPVRLVQEIQRLLSDDIYIIAYLYPKTIECEMLSCCIIGVWLLQAKVPNEVSDMFPPFVYVVPFEKGY
jgi:hypothetical protein